jgi:hypothetical protein
MILSYLQRRRKRKERDERLFPLIDRYARAMRSIGRDDLADRTVPEILDAYMGFVMAVVYPPPQSVTQEELTDMTFALIEAKAVKIESEGASVDPGP